MIFHESLNPERKFSLAIPLVFIAILGGTTGVVSVATVLSSDDSYAISRQSQLAQAAAPAGSDKSECTADSPTGQIDPATKKVKKVGKKCKPAAKKGEAIVTVDDGCEPNDYIKAGMCRVTYCSPGKVCAEIEQASEPKNIPQSTKQLFQMIENVRTAPEGGAEFVGLKFTDPKYPGTLFAKDVTDNIIKRFDWYEGDFDASIPAPNKGGISALDEIKGFGGGDGFTGEGVGANGARPLNPSTASDVNWLSPAPLGGTPEAGFSQEGPGLNNPILSGNTFQGGMPSDTDIAKATEEGFKNALPIADGDWAKDFNYQTAGGDALDSSVAKAAADANGDWACSDCYNSSPKEIDRALFAQLQKDPYSFTVPSGEVVQNPDNPRQMFIGDVEGNNLLTYTGPLTDPAAIRDWVQKEFSPPSPTEPRPYRPGDPIPRTRIGAGDAGDFNYETAGANPEPGSGLLKEGEQVPSPKPKPAQAPDPKNDPLAAVNNRKPADNAGCDNAECFDKKPAGPSAKAPVDPNGNPSGAGKTGGGGTPDGNKASGGGDIGKALGSMLEGLMKALGAPQPAPAAPAQACATDQNAYAQQQQQYQQQLQQYNYQLQQYQYQQQVNQYYAERNGGIAPPSQPPPTQPTPCVPSTGSQCKAQPQQPPASACSAGAWRATYSGACISGWQCISTQGPKAELACEPDLADVGATLALTYNCSSGVASSSAFQVTTQPGGSATTTVKAPPPGTNTATYTLACTDNGKTTGAQCSVKVNRPTIILVANPKTVPSGEISLLTWLTTGMDSCIISSPDQPDFTARNSSNTSVTGAATTSPIASGTAMFQLDCITKGGMERQATTSVSVAP